MPRLKHAVTGSVVNVPDSLVADLGGEWRPLDTPEPGPEAGEARKKPVRAKK